MIHMEGSNKGGEGRVGAGGGEDDMSDGMHCMSHPHRNNNNNTNPGGICAFCLQEKLGKLVSSSSPLPIRPSSSYPPPSSSPSFRSTTASSATTTTYPSVSFTSKTTSAPAATSSAKKNGTNHHQYHDHYMRSRLPFLLAKKNKKKNPISTNSSSSATSDIIFKRSKSTATPRRRGKFLDEAEEDDDDIVIEDFNFISPRRRNWFWSFLYLSSKPSSSSPLSSSSTKKFDTKSFRENSNGSPRMSAVNAASCTSRDKCSSLGSSLGRKSDMVVEEEEGDSASASASSLERKVSRSRSVGCGSRSFSGDFFERISTGFGDCTLRRVESQREGSKTKVAAAAANRGGHHHQHHHSMKERVMCGGLFGGFMLTSSFWVSSSADNDGMNNGSGRSWGWAFASPMRAFGSKTSSKDSKRDNNNATPNLSAIPSLLTVSS